MSVPTVVKVAVAGLFGALALAATAHADSISFMRGGDIWIASPDGTKQVQLTHDGGYSYQSQADNGDFIALRGRRLRLIGRDGRIKADFSTPVSGERTDTTSSYFLGPFKPEISPDGTKVAYEYRYFEITNHPGCVPEGTPNCQDVRQHTGIGYTYSDRMTSWDEPGLGRQSGWVDPSWIGNDTVLISDKSVQFNLDAMIDHPGDGNQTLQGWFLDDNAWYVRDGEVARSGDKVAFVTTRPKGANEDLHLDDQVSIYKMNGAPPALPTACYSYNNPAGAYDSPSFAPGGGRIAFEDTGNETTPHRILVGSVPNMTTRCSLPSAGAAQILTDARQPDWGPANVPPAPVVKPPVAATGTASSVTATGAKLAGTVDPEGARTTYRFEYGTTTAYGSTTPDADADSGSDPVNVSADLANLRSNTTYHFRVVATNSAGTSRGADATFTTPQAVKPGASTGGAAGITASAAKVAGVINPKGSPTKFRFQYGLTTSYTSATPLQDAGAGTVNVSGSAQLANLRPGIVYHYRVVASNSAGASYGLDRTFTTAPAVAPVVTTGAASSITRTGARLAGTVNPKGLATTYTFEYGKTTAYGTKTTAKSAGAGAIAVAASADVSNLTAGTTYHYRISATNGAGTTVGVDRTFTTSPPPAAPSVVTGTAAYVSQTYAQLNGTVNPQGTPTTYQFEYGTTTALGSKTAETDAGSGTTASNRVAELNGLTPNTTYYYRVVARSSAGTAVGTTKSFKTLDTTGPLSTTGAASAITRTSATVAGTINPRGELTNYRFEYGLTTSYGQVTPDGFLFGGTTTVNVTEALTGLQPGKTYHYRLVAEGESNNSAGVDKTFTTPA
jgi:phosphodiesterase/alkaline phosphatase D-like protein